MDKTKWIKLEKPLISGGTLTINQAWRAEDPIGDIMHNYDNIFDLVEAYYVSKTSKAVLGEVEPEAEKAPVKKAPAKKAVAKKAPTKKAVAKEAVTKEVPPIPATKDIVTVATDLKEAWGQKLVDDLFIVELEESGANIDEIAQSELLDRFSVWFKQQAALSWEDFVKQDIEPKTFAQLQKIFNIQ